MPFFLRVTPYTGAWIETVVCLVISIDYESRTLHRCADLKKLSPLNTAITISAECVIDIRRELGGIVNCALGDCFVEMKGELKK